VDVLTLDGMVEMKVRAGTQSGTNLNLQGRGIVHTNSPKNKRGHQYVKIQVDTPIGLTERQIEVRVRVKVKSFFKIYTERVLRTEKMSLFGV
jgi:DnaJ-class molecular chaperone